MAIKEGCGEENDEARSSGLEGQQGHSWTVRDNTVIVAKGYRQTVIQVLDKAALVLPRFYLITLVGCSMERYERRKGQEKEGGWLQDGSFFPH